MTYFTRFVSDNLIIPVKKLDFTIYNILKSLCDKSSFMKMNNYLIDFIINRFNILSITNGRGFESFHGNCSFRRGGPLPHQALGIGADGLAHWSTRLPDN